MDEIDSWYSSESILHIHLTQVPKESRPNLCVAILTSLYGNQVLSEREDPGRREDLERGMRHLSHPFLERESSSHLSTNSGLTVHKFSSIIGSTLTPTIKARYTNTNSRNNGSKITKKDQGNQVSNQDEEGQGP